MRYFCLAIFLACCLSASAEIVLYDHFENPDHTEANILEKSDAFQYDFSTDYNKTKSGNQSFHVTAPDSQVTVTFKIPELSTGYFQIWFYERGWENKVKVDQQYLLLTNSVIDGNIQIGQTGNSTYDGHYLMLQNPGSDWVTSQTESQPARWVKFSVVMIDGDITLYVDDKEEFHCPNKWEKIDGFGIFGLGKNPPDARGGVNDAYWDDLLVTDDGNPTEIPYSLADASQKLTTSWGHIKQESAR